MPLFKGRRSTPEPTPTEVPTADPRYIRSILSESGFPSNEHNLDAVAMQVSAMFALKGHEFISKLGTPQQLARFKQECNSFNEDPMLRPQQILDNLAAWNTEVIPYIQDLPDRVHRILLDGRGEQGHFFGPNPAEPLPMRRELFG